jgi:NAD(P)-dependent dehydrogenase (short-subunit alcohol dehydrogenase family)
MQDLDDKVAVVTGAASGIGRALAERFAAEGMRLVLADVEDVPLQDAVDALRSTGAEAVGVVTDVRFEEEVQRLADRALEAFGAVHVVCNNAGVETGGRFAEIPASSWKWVLDVNLWGVIHGCKIFLPILRRQGEGHIVNTGSGASFATGLPTFAPYIAAKFAVLGLSESLEQELRSAGERIGVSLLAPGPVKTRMPDSERNRPQEVPGTEGDPLRADVVGLIRRVTEQVGMEPAVVAGMVLDAIRENRFFVLTHPEDPIGAVRTRLAWMEGGPPPAPLGLDDRYTSPAA